MICSSCGTQLVPQAAFCGTCGRLADDPLLGAQLGERYRIEAKIAIGGFGAIYRATQLRTGRRVAIKVMHRELASDPKLAARFRREAAALCSLRDAHTVTTYELDETPDGQLFIVMELLEGRDLLEVFRANGPLPWRRVLAIARAVCSALAEAHALGIVHRDLKPANIYLETRHAGEDFAKVLDFGIAKIMQGSGIDDGNDLTILGQAVGTLEYMAPEQLIGGKCDGRTDLYTLGVVAFEMIPGRRPFAAAGPVELLSVQLSELAPDASLFAAVPAGVDQVLARCLARDAEDRFADAGSLSAALDELLAQPDAPDAPVPGLASSAAASASWVGGRPAWLETAPPTEISPPPEPVAAPAPAPPRA
ncbi:MAG: protein kinase domain-containing protein, partial [Kofleriaceae bacterium]